MKTTYDSPREFVETVKKKDKWFTFERQDELILHLGFKLYLDYEPEDRNSNTFWECLEEARQLLRIYYNHRYNPESSTGR